MREVCLEGLRRSLLALCWVSSCALTPAGVYADFYLGRAATRDAQVGIEQPRAGTDLTFSRVPLADRSFTPPLYYGLRAGYLFGSPGKDPGRTPSGLGGAGSRVPPAPGGTGTIRRVRFGFEIEFLHYKAVARTGRRLHVRGTLDGAPVSGSMRMDTIVQKLEISHGVNLLTANAVGRLALGASTSRPGGRLQVSLGVGAGPALLHPESVVGGRPRSRYEWDGLVVQAFAGLRTHPFAGPRAGRLALLAEYKYSVTGAGFDVAGGRGEVDLRTHHLLLGSGWRF